MALAVVVTLRLAVPLPLASILGFTVHVVCVALKGREQDRFTCDAKPFWAEIDMALVKVAVCPALTVSVVVPVDVIEKSGGPVTVKFTALDEVGVGTGLTTVTG